MAAQILGVVIQIGIKFALAAIFPPDDINVEGPRLSDLAVTTSTYGRQIPICFGAPRLAGNMIWSTEIEEVTVVDRQSGKGSVFAPDVVTTSYSYYANLAIAFSEGPVVAMRKLWLDKKVVYDSSPGQELFTKYPGAGIRFYPGSETQLPDALIQEIEGVDLTPAHRGMCYIVLERLPLEDFANSIPRSIEAQLQYSATIDTTVVELTSDFGSDALSGGHVTVNQTRRLLYILNESETGPIPAGSFTDYGGLEVWDMKTDTLIASITSAEIRAGQPGILVTPMTDLIVKNIVSHTSGELLLIGDGANIGNAFHQVMRLNPYTLEHEDIITARRNGTGINAFLEGDYVVDLERVGGTGINRWVMVTGFGDDGMKVMLYIMRRKDSRITSILGDNEGELLATLARTFAGDWEITGITKDRTGRVWVSAFDTDQTDSNGNEAHLIVHRVWEEVSLITDKIIEQILGPTTIMESEFYDLSENMSTKTRGAFAAADVAIHQPKGLAYDRSSHSVFVFGDVGGAIGADAFRWIQFDIGTESIIAVKTLDRLSPSNDFVFEPNKNSSHFGSSGGKFYGIGTSPYQTDQYQTVTRVGMLVEAVTTGLVSQSSRFEYHDRLSNTTIWPSGTTASISEPDVPRIYHDRTTQLTVSLADVVLALALRAQDIEAGDLDLTDSDIVAATVSGYMVGKRMSVRDAIDPLVYVYQFDAFESDFKMKFKSRGSAAVSASITEDDLGSHIGNTNPDMQLLPWLREQEVDIPQRVDIRYQDPERDYQANDQHASRIQSPTPTMYSRTSITIEVPCVLSATQAKQVAETGLYNRWISRVRYTPLLGPKYIRLDPTDTIDVTVDNATSTMLVSESELRRGFISELRCRGERNESYVSTSAGVSTPTRDSTLETPGPTEGLIMDVPLIRDEDIDAVGSIGVYIGFGPSSSVWSGAETQVSEDAVDFSRLKTGTEPTPWGYVTQGGFSALPLQEDQNGRTQEWNGRITGIDRTSVLRIYVVDGSDQLETITDELLLAGGNFMWISTGELLQFRDVEDLGGGFFNLSYFLRGRRGTEHAATEGTSPGAKFALLNSAWIQRAYFKEKDIGQVFYTRTATNKTKVVDAALGDIRLLGNALKPYSPDHPMIDAGAEAGEANRQPILTWKSRAKTRSSQDLEDATVEIQNEQIPRIQVLAGFEVVLLDKDDPDTEAISIKVPHPDVAVPPLDSDDPLVQITTANITAAGYNAAAGEELRIIIYQLFSMPSAVAVTSTTDPDTGLPTPLKTYRGIGRLIDI